MVAESRRRLAVILHADVVGSTSLVALDETLAHDRIRDVFSRLAGTTADYGGVAREIRGDALVAEFARASDAVSAALVFQHRHGEWLRGLTDDLRPATRIGISLGEVVIADGTITGTGVVMAQRLEQLAGPGTVVVQGSVAEAVPSRLPFAFRSLGPQRLKGFEQPVQAFAVDLREGAELPAPEAGDGVRASGPQPPGPGESLATSAATRPRIAVLPFANMSGDAAHESFCDGISEDVITALSRSRRFSVASRSSTFAYKGRSPDVREAARELGASYVLEGSVRRSGARVRITAHLVDAASGNYTWAEQYNFDGDDEFAMQDDFTHRVASVLSERIWQDVSRKLERKSPEGYSAGECADRAIEFLHRLEPDSVAHAATLLEKALELAPELSAAHLGLGFCHVVNHAFWGDPSGQALARASFHAARLERLAPDDAQTFRLLSRVHIANRRFAEARVAVERALRLNPDDGDIIANKGCYLLYLGECMEAVAWFDRVLALHPDTPHTVDIMLMWKSIACLASGRHQAATDCLRAIAGLDYVKCLLLAAAHAQAGQTGPARAMADAVLRVRPALRVADVGLWRMFRRAEEQRKLRDALRLAGLPA